MARLYPFWSSRAESNVPDLSSGRVNVRHLEQEQTAQNRSSGSVALCGARQLEALPWTSTTLASLKNLWGTGRGDEKCFPSAFSNRFVQAAISLHYKGEHRLDDSEVWNFYVWATGTMRVSDAVIVELQAAFKPLCLSLGAFCFDGGHDPYEELPTFLHSCYNRSRACPT